MKILLLLLTNCILISYGYVYDNYEENLIDARMLAEEEYQANCTKPGLLCTDCHTLVQCIPNGNGAFDEIELETCEANSTCLNNECSTKPNPNCMTTSVTFECTGTAVFPDPFDCKIFHFCAKDKILEGKAGITSFKCEDNYGYDPVTTYCKNKLVNNNCTDFPVPVCTKVGQTGALTNKSIYYICIKKNKQLYPKLFVCPNGKIYENYECKAK